VPDVRDTEARQGRTLSGCAAVAAALCLSPLSPISLLHFVASVDGRAAVVQTPQSPSGGSSTAGVFAPVKDAKKRPITAGGFVDDGPLVFEDRTKGSGLEAFRHRSGSPDKSIILDTPSGGVGLIDVDNDGWLDVYLVNGSTRDALKGAAAPPRAALFRNNHDLTFTDITERAGVANERWGFGVAAGDFDNDGWTDLYVTNFGPNRLYRNNRNGTFTDVAGPLGVAAGGWSTGATFGDYDNDNLLDLFVAGYVDIDPERPDPGAAPCVYRGERVMCGPRGLRGTRDWLFHNDGGRFVDVTAQAGVADTAGYYGFAAAWVDIDDDSDLDLLVVNDSTPNYLYRNNGTGRFEEIGFASGFAVNEDGREQAGMGLALGDYDNDGRVDSYITNFSDDSNTLRHNLGNANLADVTSALRLRIPTIPFLGWGTGFLDFDNDGWLDLFVANGHAYPTVDRFDWGTTWAQRPLLFRSAKGARFDEVPARSGSGLAAVVPARGAAFGDLDHDGRLDVVLNNHDQMPTLLRNVAAAGHWITIALDSGPGAARGAVGAVITVRATGLRLRRDVISGGSYCSQSDFHAHFGLGSADTIDHIEVRWPGGWREVFSTPGVDRLVTLKKGEGKRQEP
jgi:enediyne biosynthesis protein E4